MDLMFSLKGLRVMKSKKNQDNSNKNYPDETESYIFPVSITFAA